MLFRTSTIALVEEIESDSELYDRYTDLTYVFLKDSELFTNEQERFLKDMTHYLQCKGEISRAINIKSVNFTHVLCSLVVDIRDCYTETLETDNQRMLYQLQLNYDKL